MTITQEKAEKEVFRQKMEDFHKSCAEVSLVSAFILGISFPFFLDLKKYILQEAEMIIPGILSGMTMAQFRVFAYDLLCLTQWLLFTSFILATVGLLLDPRPKFVGYLKTWRTIFYSFPLVFLIAGSIPLITIFTFTEETGDWAFVAYALLFILCIIFGIIRYLADTARKKETEQELNDDVKHYLAKENRD